MTNDGPRRLRRSRDRKIAGVAGGIAEYLDLDPTLVRLAFVVFALLGLGGTAVAYLALWLVIPGPASESGEAPALAPQSKLLVALIAVVIALSLAGTIVWVGLLSVQLLRLSLPVWVVLIVGTYLIVRSQRTRAS